MLEAMWIHYVPSQIYISKCLDKVGCYTLSVYNIPCTFNVHNTQHCLVLLHQLSSSCLGKHPLDIEPISTQSTSR